METTQRLEQHNLRRKLFADEEAIETRPRTLPGADHQIRRKLFADEEAIETSG